MTLTCPHCGFSKEVQTDRMPANGRRLVCPNCRRAFAVAAPAPAMAGFLLRTVAAILDLGLVFLGLFMGLGVLGVTAFNRLGGIDPGGNAAFGFLTTLFCLAFWCAYWVFFTGYCGQTPGKMMLRLKVVSVHNAAVGFSGTMLRELVGKFLSGMLFGTGFLMVAFSRKKQGLHDLIAETYVVKI